MAIPVVKWYEGSQDTANEVKTVVQYGVVDADTTSAVKTFYIWNNRGGTTPTSTMEDVTFTTRDMSGGLGDTVGSTVEAVQNNWFKVRCDSMGDTEFTAVGKGGIGTVNPSGTKKLGTTGATTDVNNDKATAFTTSVAVALNVYVKPTVDNEYIYKVTKAGTTGATEPSWIASEGAIIESGTAIFTAVKIKKTPLANQILGAVNATTDDGANAMNAAGNFVQISALAEVPINASSGLNRLQYRISYRFV